MPNDNTKSGRAPLSGLNWNLSVPNTVALIGVLAVVILVALRGGFRPVILS